MNNMRAPVIVFAYNRPRHLQRVLKSLSENIQANDTDLFIYCDGAKKNTKQEEINSILEVQKIAGEWNWCGPQKTLVISQNNKGLGPSVIDGVSQVVKKYGQVIVVEDDLVLSPYFLSFMNKALAVYEHEADIYQISGYMYPIEVVQPDFCFLRVCSSWGWATWKNRWDQLKTDVISLKKEIETRDEVDRFNLDGSYPMMNQLELNISGKLNTWAIKWYATTFLANGLVIHPNQSLVFNDGFDGSGSNCGESRDFQVQLAQKDIPVYSRPVVEDREVRENLVVWLKKVNGITPPSRKIIDRVRQWFLN